MDASEPKWVNHILNTIGVNSLKLGGLQFRTFKLKNHILTKTKKKLDEGWKGSDIKD